MSLSCVNSDAAYARCRRFRCMAVTALIGVLSVSVASGGSELSYDTKETPQAPIVEIPVARASRGLVTSEGPSGMFLNPTSATLPQGAIDFGYCFILTAQDTDVLGHSFFLSYGVRDWLEL